MRITSLDVQLPAASHQTAPIAEYNPAFQQTATELFRRICCRVPSGRVNNPDGSFSILGGLRNTTVARILIYEAGKGKINGLDPCLEDGVYVLIRTTGGSRAKTIGVAPWHDTRFAYLRLLPGQDLDEMADFIAACADAM
jgi:hypothetical protein